MNNKTAAISRPLMWLAVLLTSIGATCCSQTPTQTLHGNPSQKDTLERVSQSEAGVDGELRLLMDAEAGVTTGVVWCPRKAGADCVEVLSKQHPENVWMIEFSDDRQNAMIIVNGVTREGQRLSSGEWVWACDRGLCGRPSSVSRCPTFTNSQLTWLQSTERFVISNGAGSCLSAQTLHDRQGRTIADISSDLGSSGERSPNDRFIAVGRSSSRTCEVTGVTVYELTDGEAVFTLEGPTLVGACPRNLGRLTSHKRPFIT